MRDDEVCESHSVQFCMVCVTDQMQQAHASANERRRQLRAERRQMSVHELFDLGGES